MSKIPPARRPVSFRLRPEVVAQLRAWVRDMAGAPMYLRLSDVLEAAILREIERGKLIASGALPPDAPAGEAASTADLVAGRRAAIDHLNHAPAGSPGCTRR